MTSLERIRLIARLDIKGPNVIKGRQMEGLRVVGDPWELAQIYCDQGADEILYNDSVASLYGRENLRGILSYAAQNLRIPLTAVGGVRTVKDGRELLRSGADKVGVNTGALERVQLLHELADEFGSQAVVLSVEAKRRHSAGGWKAMMNGGRDDSGKDVIEWIQMGLAAGAGEVLLTSVDRDGTRRGMDTDLIQMASKVTTVPLVVSGGAGSVQDLMSVISSSSVQGIAIGASLHGNQMTVHQTKEDLRAHGVSVRRSDA